MLENGNYAAWFKTPRGEGTGIVTLSNGTIAGGDNVIAYSGSYEQTGDLFTATVRTRRFCEGQPSVFGIDEVELKLAGRLVGAMVVCSGTAEQAPGLTFRATLIPSRGQSSVGIGSKPPPVTPAFDAAKLPKERSR